MSEDEPLVSSSSAAKRQLLFAGEIATVLSALAFLVSAVLNRLIFSNWNINYLQIASPADVLMGGLDLLFRAWPVLLGISLGFVTSRQRNSYSVGLMVALWIGSVAGYFLNAYIRGISFFSLWREIAGFLIVCAIWRWSGGIFVSTAKAWDRNRLGSAASYAFSCGIFYTFVSMTPGFWPPGTLFVAHESPPPCARPILLWSGTSAAIVECPDRRLIIRSEGEQFITPGPASDQSLAPITNFIRTH
jgi:hypothetical protein